MTALPEEPASISEEEYLAGERTGEIRHEYVRGEVFAVAGASWKHVLICANLMGIFYVQLRGQSCRASQSDLRVQVKSADSYRYPDIVVVCSEPQFADDEFDTLLNPTILIEVLSSTSATRDRGEKLAEYRQLESLQEYLLISQHEPHIERLLRQKDNTWLLSDTIGLDATLELPSINCRLAMADVYEQVRFGENESQD